MRQEIFKEIEVPEGVTVTIDESTLTAKGSEGENIRLFNTAGLEFKVDGDKVIVGSKKATKTEKKIIHTFAAHVTNMISGVSEKFEYKLKVCFNHFPITVELTDKTATIKNFLGEKIPRIATLMDGSEVSIDGEVITVKSVNKEIAGQTAANFEAVTKIKNRDRRIFQDGIFITSKNGKEI